MHRWLFQSVRKARLVKNILFSLREIDNHRNTGTDESFDFLNDIAAKFGSVDSLTSSTNLFCGIPHRDKKSIIIFSIERHRCENDFSL